MEHLETLKKSLLSVIEGDADTGIKIHADLDADTWKAVFDLPGADRVDPLWSILIGEILYQLRSSLDHIINAVVKAPTKDTKFPVLLSKSEFNGEAPNRQLEGICAMDRAVTELLQPFRLNPRAPKNTTPWGLNELAVLDRHRVLHTSGLWLSEESRIIFNPAGSGTVDYSMDLPGPIEDGAVIASGRLLRTPDQPEVDVQVFGVPDLVLTSVDGFRGEPDMRGIKASALEIAARFVWGALEAYRDPLGFLIHEGMPGQDP